MNNTIVSSKHRNHNLNTLEPSSLFKLGPNVDNQVFQSQNRSVKLEFSPPHKSLKAEYTIQAKSYKMANEELEIDLSGKGSSPDYMEEWSNSNRLHLSQFHSVS